MSVSRLKFDHAIWKTVSSIRPGQVMSYGQVARLAGYPRHARMVSKAMARSAQALPWHRVVKSDLRLAFAKGSEAYEKQKSLLIKEGIEFVNGKISGHHRDDEKTLDEWLWGPPA